MESITVDNLVSLIEEYKKGIKKQQKPEIIWFDRVEGDLLKYSPKGFYESFANSISENDGKIALNLQTGSPLTDHDQLYDEENNIVRKITDKERFSFIIPPAVKFDDRGNLLSKVYLHTSPTSYMGKRGLTTLEFSKMVHDNLHLPVLLFFPLNWREKLKDKLNGYKELVCTDDLEAQKQRWLERVSKMGENGIQIVDNYFLDFLKVAPNKLLSKDFDDSGEIVVGIVPRYENWQRLSREMRRLVKRLVNLQHEGEGSQKIFESLFTDCNLNFEKISDFLNTLSDETWDRFLKQHCNNFKEYQHIIDAGDRLDIFKLLASTGKTFIPKDATKSLLEFHGIEA